MRIYNLLLRVYPASFRNEYGEEMRAMFARRRDATGPLGAVGLWLETFAESFTAPLPPAERPAFLAEVRDALRPALCDAAGRWTADYVRLRFAADRPAKG